MEILDAWSTPFSHIALLITVNVGNSAILATGTIVKRPAVIEAIAEARAHGDLKENAEYHAAKEQQGMVEARIRDIEAKLSNAQIIDVTQLSASGRVVFGATVHLVDVESGESAQYQIVGEDEYAVILRKVEVLIRGVEE